jgi:hypothetical protein
MASSYILDYENAANACQERRETIAQWKKRAAFDAGETSTLLEIGKKINNLGIKAKTHYTFPVRLFCIANISLLQIFS